MGGWEARLPDASASEAAPFDVSVISLHKALDQNIQTKGFKEQCRSVPNLPESATAPPIPTESACLTASGCGLRRFAMASS